MSHTHDRWRVYRSSPRGHAPIPLSVRSVGRYTVDTAWHEESKKKWFLQLFWGVEGQGNFFVGKERFAMQPGDLFIYRPGDYHHIATESHAWTYCWLTFDHPDCVHWIEAFGIKQRITQAGPCPQPLFDQIADRLRDCTPEGERQSSLLAYELLLQTTRTGGPQPESALASEAKAYLGQHFENPALSINALADRLKVHRSTLFRSFTAHYGLTPSHYLQNLRVQKALTLLQRRDLQIQDVARLAGFADANYFSRVIHNALGMSPREFRNSG